jgi:methionyl-tRNA formyltransferase
MRIVLIMQDDPFYLPAVIERVAEGRQGQIAGVAIPTIGSRGRRVSKMISRSLTIYGGLGTLRQGGRYLWWKVLDKLATAGSARSVKTAAQREGIRVVQPSSVNDSEFLQWLRELEPDLIASVSAEEVFGSELLSIPRLGCINVHSSMLPLYRGLYPSFWVLANGERETGVTVHEMDNEIDNGAILLQRRVAIDEEETQDSLLRKTKRMAADLLLEAFDRLDNGTLEPLLNDAAAASYYGFPTRDDVRRFRARGRRFW